MAALDGRLARKESHPVGLVAKKVRKIGSPSQSLPPANAPSWAVSPDYGKGKIHANDSLCIIRWQKGGISYVL
jgi:hypothetical protein